LIIIALLDPQVDQLEIEHQQVIGSDDPGPPIRTGTSGFDDWPGSDEPVEGYLPESYENSFMI
jgi:hypothetical protein